VKKPPRPKWKKVGSTIKHRLSPLFSGAVPLQHVKRANIHWRPSGEAKKRKPTREQMLLIVAYEAVKDIRATAARLEAYLESFR
jgi:hypothetical protein